ncbi:hypothetical protein ABZ805_28505 [Saccharopolyspora sp. NPDC047091]|uniref:hypothetical protein n=1 Tax=Saccharopolyspora sp. NPDC047091 TaxID=3155924 RepID=UPI0033C7F01C
MSTGDAAEGGRGRAPRRSRAAVDDAVRAREEMGAAVDGADRAVEPASIPDARAEPGGEPGALSERDALLDVAVRGHRLALLLDGLARRHATPGTARPADAHVALDQAAAAAEDLGNCVQAAAAAIAEQHDAER